MQQAIVIGGSISGLLAARVLSDHFTQVTLIEQDTFGAEPEARRGQPQTRHLHALLASGREILEAYFPGLTADLQAGGATLADMGSAARWHIMGGYRCQQANGMLALMMSRPYLEWQIRQRVLQLPNLQVLDGYRVSELVTCSEGGAGIERAKTGQAQVTGVKIRPTGDQPTTASSTNLSADVVVDATGRGTAAFKWLAQLGYPTPPETQVTVNVGYATRLYRRRPEDLLGAELVIVSPQPPSNHRSGVVVPIEGDRWIVTLVSAGGAPPPLDADGFLDFAHQLPAPDIYDLLHKLEPISETVGYRYPASLRRHYEKLAQFPAGYLLIGDALCSFNPTYGQGMASAAMQAAALDRLLRSQPDLSQLAPQFFRAVAKILDIPWQLAVGEDFRFSSTEGPKSLGTDVFNHYADYVHRATHTDPEVYTAFLRVMNLLAPPVSLLQPQVLWRVWQANRLKIQTLNPKERL